MMKKIVFMAMILFGATVMAQDVKPNFEKNGDVIKGTFFYDNGTIQQEGTYKDGKLHGEWIMYNADGKKTAIGNYTHGEKTGKWFFWKNDRLVEVDYSTNEIASVTNWKSESSLVRNQ